MPDRISWMWLKWNFYTEAKQKRGNQLSCPENGRGSGLLT